MNAVWRSDVWSGSLSSNHQIVGDLGVCVSESSLFEVGLKGNQKEHCH